MVCCISDKSAVPTVTDASQLK